MAHIEIDLMGDSEEEPKAETKKAIEPEHEAERNRLLRKQVINIDGQIVDL